MTNSKVDTRPKESENNCVTKAWIYSLLNNEISKKTKCNYLQNCHVNDSKVP